MDDEQRSVHVHEPLYREDTIELPGEKASPLTYWLALWRDPRRQLRTWFELVGVFLLVNVAVAPLMDAFNQNDPGALLVYACFGIIPVQAAALSVWLAWGPRPFWRRLWVHWSIAAVAVAAWLFGLVLADGFDDLDDGLEIVLPTALLFGLAVQLPLWIVRGIWGWRLVRRGHGEPPADEKLSIRDLMVGTVIVAVSMAAVRVSPESNESGFWPAMGMMVLISSGASVAFLPPAAAWLLGGRSSARGVLWTLLYAILAGVVLIVAYFVLEQPISGHDAWEMFCASVSIFSFAAMLILTAIAARRTGWRLARS
jgi:hypothetical protein